MNAKRTSLCMLLAASMFVPVQSASSGPGYELAADPSAAAASLSSAAAEAD